MMTWARRRQLTYLLGLLFFFSLIGLVVFLVYRPIASCFDGRRNQTETGVDCGGGCLLACSNEVKPLKILWARPLVVSSGRFDLVARLENPNLDLGTRQLSYRFSLYDNNNVLLATRVGETFVNPGEKFTLFASRLDTNGQPVGRVFLEFLGTINWEKVRPGTKDISLERQDFINQPKPRLSLAVDNAGLVEVRDLELVTILSDINNNAFAASATTLDKLLPGQRRDVYFTWPESFASEPSYVDSFWRVNVFSAVN